MVLEGAEGRKISIVRILQVLVRHSDKDHPLSQQQVLEWVKEDYGLSLGRKAVARNLMRLKEEGLPVSCREVMRTIRGKAAPLTLDWYWEHDLSEEDLQAIIDILYASQWPYATVKSLAEKLKRREERFWDDGKAYVRNIPSHGIRDNRPELLLLLSKAIGDGKRIAFACADYGVDGKRHIVTDPDGNEKTYVLSPYLVVSSAGDYYLIGAPEGRSVVSVYRTDRMEHVEILEEVATPSKEIPGLENGVKVSRLMSTFSIVCEGEPETCTFTADISLMNRIRHDFGGEAHILSAAPSTVTVEVEVAPRLLKAWALMLAPQVQITSPMALVKEMRDALSNALRVHGGG